MLYKLYLSVILSLSILMSILFLNVQNAFTQGIENIPGYRPVFSQYSGVLVVKPDLILAYGLSGIINISNDGGHTWHQKYAGIQSQIVKMHKYKEQIIAITNDAYFVISNDNGNTWKLTKAKNIESTVNNFVINEDGRILVSSSSNKVYFTQSITEDFYELNNFMFDKVTALDFVNNEFAISTANSKIYLSSDGVNWKAVVLSETNNNIFVKSLSFFINSYYILTNNGLIRYNELDKKSEFLSNIPSAFAFDIESEEKIYLFSQDVDYFIKITEINGISKESKSYFTSFDDPEATVAAKNVIIDLAKIAKDKYIFVGLNSTIAINDTSIKQLKIISNVELYKNDYSSMLWLSNNNVLVYGGDILYYSRDAGITWKKSIIENMPNFGLYNYIGIVFTADNVNIYALLNVSNYVYMLYSNDAGKTFKIREHTYNNSAYAYSFTPFFINNKWYAFYSQYIEVENTFHAITYIESFDENFNSIKKVLFDSSAVFSAKLIREDNSIFVQSQYSIKGDKEPHIKLHRVYFMQDTLIKYNYDEMQTDSLLFKINKMKFTHLSDTSGYCFYYRPITTYTQGPIWSGLVNYSINNNKFNYELIKEDSSFVYKNLDLNNDAMTILGDYELLIRGKDEQEWTNKKIKYAHPYNLKMINDVTYLLASYGPVTNNLLFRSIEPEFITSVETNEIQEKAHLQYTAPYPIPAQNYVKSTIYWNSVYDINQAKYSVSDVFGTTIPYHNISIDQTDSYKGILNWDCTGISSGIYFIRVQLGAETITVPVAVGK